MVEQSVIERQFALRYVREQVKLGDFCDALLLNYSLFFPQYALEIVFSEYYDDNFAVQGSFTCRIPLHMVPLCHERILPKVLARA